MAGQQNIGISLVSPESISRDSGDWLKIIQPEWPEEPAGGFFAWAIANGHSFKNSNLMEYYAMFRSHCAKDGVLEVELQIHRSRSDLNYTLTTSYGELSDCYLHTAEIKTSITIEGKSELNLERQVLGEIGAVWEGPVYDMAGAQILPPPLIRQSGSVLSFGLQVVGVLRVAYTQEYDAYILTVTPRVEGDYAADDREGAYQATVMAIWGGQVESHDIDLPDMSGFCGSNSALKINPDNDDDGGGCVKHIILVNPCTKAIVREWDENIPCPESADAAGDD